MKRNQWEKPENKSDQGNVFELGHLVLPSFYASPSLLETKHYNSRSLMALELNPNQYPLSHVQFIINNKELKNSPCLLNTQGKWVTTQKEIYKTQLKHVKQMHDADVYIVQTIEKKKQMKTHISNKNQIRNTRT